MSIVASILCHNDLIYLKNLIPQVEKFADRIIVTDDCSDDGTKEYLATRRVEHIVHKFNLNFSDQRNIALQEVDNGDWFFRIDSDELPTKWCVNNIRQIVEYFEKHNVNRTSITIFHLINLCMCKVQLGFELRLFQKNDSCFYRDKIHEYLHGNFGDKTQAELPDWCALVHFKHADCRKIKITEEFYLPNNLYDKGDWERRVTDESTYLPASIHFDINQSLRDYLCTNPISKVSE